MITKVEVLRFISEAAAETGHFNVSKDEGRESYDIIDKDGVTLGYFVPTVGKALFADFFYPKNIDPNEKLKIANSLNRNILSVRVAVDDEGDFFASQVFRIWDKVSASESLKAWLIDASVIGDVLKEFDKTEVQ